MGINRGKKQQQENELLSGRGEGKKQRVDIFAVVILNIYTDIYF